MPSIYGHRGYLEVDHTNSPGISEADIRKAGLTGKAVATPEGRKFEADTFTCPHCTRPVLMNPLREHPRNICRQCMRTTCHSPGCVVDCVPFAKIIDTAQTQNERDQTKVLKTIAALRRDILG